MNRDIIPAWRGRPVSGITRKDIAKLVDDVEERAPVQANRTVTVLQAFFGWCMDRYVEADPTARLKKPTKERSRKRVLSDSELCAFWGGCERLGWPFGRLLQLLALTAARKTEVAGMRWPELAGLDGDNAVLAVPPERYKTDRTLIIPLNAPAVAIIGVLPKVGTESGLVFTTTDKTPVSGFSKAKAELDAYMLEELRADAPEPDQVTLAPWIIHDLRRTVRTNLSRLKVDADIGERVLGHVIKGVRGIYDQWEFVDEKRDALDRWAVHLDGIVNPRRAKVVKMARRGR
jgi:integrase